MATSGSTSSLTSGVTPYSILDAPQAGPAPAALDWGSSHLSKSSSAEGATGPGGATGLGGLLDNSSRKLSGIELRPVAAAAGAALAIATCNSYLPMRIRSLFCKGVEL